MAKATCTAEGCESVVLARGFCNKHYKQRRLAAGGSFSRPSIEERFLRRIDKNGPIAIHEPALGRCWVWTGPLFDGYGRIKIGGRNGRHVGAHRWAYEHWVGPVPDGFELDHFACDNRACANPDHVKPVTHRVNSLRSAVNVTALNAIKTHCLRGHEFTPENTHIIPSGRSCRACERLRGSRAARAERARAKGVGA